MAVLYMVNCSDLSQDDRRRERRRQSDPEGEIELPENILSEDFLSFENCNPTADAPDNSTDIAIGLIFNKNDFTHQQIRRCLKDRIEKAYKQICTTREKLIEKRDRAQDQNTQTYLDNQIWRLDQIQWKFNNRMDTLAQKLNKGTSKINKKVKEKDEAWFTIAAFFLTDEMEAHRNIFDVNSYNQCESESESQF